MKPQTLTDAFIVTGPDKSATIEPNDKGIYARLDEKYAGFKGCELVACHEFESDWNSWEMHPNGDEIIVLLAGRITFILEKSGGNETVDLNQINSFIIVPKGIWHTAKTDEKTTVLFITPGEGTEHRPL